MTDFAARHIGPDEAAQRHMLDSLGYASLDELNRAALPEDAELAQLSLPDPLTETQSLAELRRMAGRNQVLTSMIGLGYYDTITPAVIRRNVLENPAWYTAYTPYQPEISQGRLEALLNFQTMIADLTALPWAGASLLDEATAAVEAMTLARRAARRGHVFLADADCLPQTLAVLRTRAEPLGIHLVVEPVTAEAIEAQGDLFGVLLQFPGASGTVRDLGPLIEAAHARGALAAVAADLLALTLLTPPGELGADIAVGSSQRFGVPLFFGGPHAGYIAVSDPLKRQLPGRLVGVSVDADGRPAYRLALQAREQHIRREKATSNICTAQVLLAVTAAMYAAYHGPEGLAAIARGAHRSAAVLAATMHEYGHRTDRGDFFDTIRIVFRGGRDEAVHALDRARAAGYNLYLAPDGALQVSCDETTTDEQLRELVAAICQVERLAEALPAGIRCTGLSIGYNLTLGVVVGMTPLVAAFLIHAHRGWDALVALLGEEIKGFVCSDRWGAYAKLSPWCRQICWAHLRRDFQKLVDRGAPSARLGRELQRVAERVFEEWHLFRGGGCDRRQLQLRLSPGAARLERLLKAGRRCADAKAATFCGNVLELLPAVWRFVVTEGIEPTNNHAERVLRRGVLWRKSAFGCSSAAGCRFVERMLTVVQTRRLQGRSVLRYLYDALVAHRNGLPAPSLLAAE